MNKLLFFILINIITTTVLLPSTTNAKEINGFILDDALIPASQIFSGGPDKDGIPSIDNPTFVKAQSLLF